MATVEDKVDMSLDEIISKRQSEAREKRVTKKPLKFSPGKKDPQPSTGEQQAPRRRAKRGKVTSGDVAVEAGKLKRASKIASKRGLASTKASEAEIATKATAAAKAKKAKKTVVNLAKKSPPPKKKPVMELAASSEERAVKVKDFNLPKNTKMVITFEPTKPTATKKKTAAATKKTPAGPAARRKNAVDKSKAARAAKVSTNRMDTSADDANGKKVRRRGAAKS